LLLERRRRTHSQFEKSDRTEGGGIAAPASLARGSSPTDDLDPRIRAMERLVSNVGNLLRFRLQMWFGAPVSAFRSSTAPHFDHFVSP